MKFWSCASRKRSLVNLKSKKINLDPEAAWISKKSRKMLMLLLADSGTLEKQVNESQATWSRSTSIPSLFVTR